MDRENINIPSLTECTRLWDVYATPEHVRQHMKSVARVAIFFSTQLLAAGISIHKEAATAAALLHDLVRVTEWERIDLKYFTKKPSPQELRVWEEQRQQWPPHIPHASINASLLREEYPFIADIIAVHSFSSIDLLDSWEKKILYYSDRRVAHTNIVTLEERLHEGSKRYGKTEDSAFLQRIFDLEKEIFSYLPIQREDTENFYTLLHEIEKNGKMNT